MSPVVQAFLERARDRQPPTPELEAELGSALRRARSAWAGVTVPEEVFGRELAARIPPDAPALDALRAMHVEDVYLAVACAQGDATALAAVERHYVPEIRKALGGMGLGSVGDETVQVMREELFVGTAERPPRIANYAGRGNLRRWFRAVAGRTALRVARRPHAGASLPYALAADGDVEVDYFKRTYGAAFRPAFQEALESLTAKDRLLLKQRFRHGLSLEDVAAMEGVHASTVSRWISDARERLVGGTRERMMARLNIGRAEAESILRLIQSQVDITLSSMVAPGG